MTYRDEREALRHRVARLEAEVLEARRAGHEEGRGETQLRTTALEQKLGEMRDELQRLEVELQAVRGPRPARARNAALWRAAALLAGCTVLGAWFALSGAPAPAVIATLPQPGAPTLETSMAAEPPPPQTDTPPAVEAPRRAVPPPSPQPTAERVVEPPPRSTTARWTAKVTKAEGLALAGATCTLEATIATNSATNAVVPGFSIRCAGKKLFDSGDDFNGMAQVSNDAREVLGRLDDRSTFTLVYRDTGSRTGDRSQVDVDTKARQGAVWRETVPRFRIELSIASESAPTKPLSGPEGRLRRTGKIMQVTGRTALKPGSACVLRAMPTGKREECAAEVVCGSTSLWPSTAPATCTFAGARPTTVSANDGRASLAVDGSTVTVHTKTVEAKLDLDPAD